MTLATIPQKWTRADEQRLRELASNHSNAEIAAIMDRTVQSVKSRVSLLRLRTRDRWTAEADRALLQDYKTLGARRLAEQLGRTALAVYQRAAKLGLTDQPKFTTDDELLAVIHEFHPQGFSDAELARLAGERHACNVDRHRVGKLRRGLRLKANNFSEHSRLRVSTKTQEQLAKAGLQSLAELRNERWNQWKRDLGWPENLTVRAVQALELFYRHGQLTRVQLCELMGVSAKKRTAPRSNAPGGTVLGELARAGLIGRLRKAIPIRGDIDLHQQPCPNSKRRRRANETKYMDLYFLNPGVEPNGETRKHVEAGGSSIAARIDHSRHASVAGSDASRRGECDRRGRCSADRAEAS